jgi:hypothetical protein
MNNDQLAQISQKLSILIALTVAGSEQKYSKSDLVGLFTQFDLANGEIATILGTTKGSVEVLKSRLKTKKG